MHAFNQSAPAHAASLAFLNKHLEDPKFAISEFVLMELYVLLRNPSVFPTPATAEQAVNVVKELRENPYWTLLKGTADVSDKVWSTAASMQFPRRAVFDARLAYSLAAEGVKHFATRNMRDFARFGAFEVFDPTEE